MGLAKFRYGQTLRLIGRQLGNPAKAFRASVYQQASSLGAAF
jgi:hypothetical protein